MVRLLPFAALLLLAVPLKAAEPRRPNILVIVGDDMGYGDVGCHGCKDIPTPNIDSIAKKGVRCTSGYVSGPYCSPTRAALLTGRYQQRFGHEFNPGPPSNANKEMGLSLKEKTLPDHLKAAGYKTVMVGKWHLGHAEKFNPINRGFDEYFGFLGGGHPYMPGKGVANNPIVRGLKPVEEKEYLTDAFAREAKAAIDRHRDKPFFLYLAFNAVHMPLQSSDRYLKRFEKIEDKGRRTYAAMMSAMDDAVGEVLSKLREHKLEEQTLVFFISDNGGPPVNKSSNGLLRGHKATTWEGGIRVPFLAQWPGKLPAGKVYDKPVIQMDITSTALAEAGIKTDDTLDGINLLPYFNGTNPGTPHEALYWRFGQQTAIRMGDWKLVRAAARMMQTGPHLFNLADDIGEKNDLAMKNPEKLKELEAAWKKWNAELAPPSWRGPGGRGRSNQE